MPSGVRRRRYIFRNLPGKWPNLSYQAAKARKGSPRVRAINGSDGHITLLKSRCAILKPDSFLKADIERSLLSDRDHEVLRIVGACVANTMQLAGTHKRRATSADRT